MDDRTVVVAREDGGILPSAMTLREYFGSKEKSGGGVLDVLDLRSDGTALITFRNTDDAVNVESRHHEVDGVALSVYPYYGPLDDSEPGYDNHETLSRQIKTKSVTFQTDDDDLMKLVDIDTATETEELHMAPGKVRFLRQFPRPDLTTLTKQFKRCSLQDDKIVVTDASTCFQEKVHQLNLELLNIHEETFEMTKPLVYSLLTSKKGVEELYKIERSLKCIIQVDQGFYTSRNQKEDNLGETEKQESIVTLVTGDLADQEVDVLVCAVDPDLDLKKGKTANELLRLGGPTLTADCQTNYPKGIKTKEIAIISGGKLKCQRIFLIALPDFKDDQKLKIFGSLMYKCLFECSEKGYSSIAFPAVGTGHNGYPPQRVAEMMFEKMTQFMSYASPLKDVRVVVGAENSSVIKAFEENKPTFHVSHDDQDGSDEIDAKRVVSHDDFRVGNLTVHVKQGDLSKDSSQALVHLVRTATALGAGSAGSDLLQECDPDINNQCRIAVTALQKTGMALTTAPGLPAEFLLHVALDYFKGSLKDVIKSCLKRAEEHRITSLALPSLWSETGNMALRNIAKVLVKCLEDLEKKTSCLKDVSLVIQEETDCYIFLSLLEELIRKKSRKGKARFSYRRRDVRRKGSQTEQTVEEMYVRNVPDSDAEITVYSDNRSALQKAFKEVVQLYDSQFVKKSMQLQNLKLLSPAKVANVKRQIDSMNVFCGITWSAGIVEIEGLPDDVQQLESVLNAAI